MAGVKGRSGRPRLPTELKRLRGTLQPCRTPKDEPHPTVGVPPCPADLDRTERRRYAVLAAELVATGVLTLSDGDALAQLARAVVRVERLSRLVRKKGEFVQIDGVSQLSAEAKALKDANEWLAKCNARFGRDPQARATVKAVAPPAPKEETERDRLRKMFGGGS